MRTLPATLAAVAALALAAPAVAEDLSYSYLDIGYATVDRDELDDSGSGYGLRLSGRLTDQLFLEATYGDVSYDETVLGVPVGIDEALWEVGLGVPWRLRENLHLFGWLGYAKNELDASAAGARIAASEDGIAAAAGVRWLVLPELEVAGRVTHRAFDDSDTAARVGVRYYVSESAALFADAEIGSNAKVYLIGLRIDVGREAR